ncbi:surfactin synthase thioesterase subunit [Nakamurella sp. UYEF19]|uniref:thioesterase II family protein n=1 Tax=Nakamurella sp. UYEF19 TaxID=1756392 RepID=UPI003393E409
MTVLTTSITTDSRWIRRFHQATDGSARLVCLPHAGGSASFYFPVSATLSPSIEVLAVQYPGRQDRRKEPFIDSLPDLADAVAEVVAPLADRPISLFGHSMGAALAFEVALRLEAQGLELADVVVSGRRAPSTFRDERTYLAGDERLLADVRTLDGTGTAVFGDPELVQIILPAIRNDYRVIETYRWIPGPRIKSPMLALSGTEDVKATPAEVQAWSEHTSAEFEMRLFPGGHFYLNNHAGAVIGMIASRLERAAA